MSPLFQEHSGADHEVSRCPEQLRILRDAIMPSTSITYLRPALFASCGLLLLCLTAGGCSDAERMEIDTDSTMANPTSFERTIPEDAGEDEAP